MQEYATFDDKQACFRSHTIVKNIKELEQALEALKDEQQKNTNHTVFRGVKEARYMLFNSLQRLWASRSLNDLGLDPMQAVQSLLSPFQGNNHVLKKYLKQLGVVCNDWWLLSFLQHYGAASPLLDFSKSYEVALFFACKDIDFCGSTNPINNYFSIYYYSNMEVCRDITTSIVTYAKNVARGMEANKTNNTAIWKNELSFNTIMGHAPNRTFILPTYTNKTKIRNTRREVVTTYTMANLNVTSQEGEFVCNMNMEMPLEQIFKKATLDAPDKYYISSIDIHKGLRDYIIKKYLGGTLKAATMKYFPSERTIAQEAQQLWLETLNS